MARDYSDQFNTKLKPEEEAEFQQWAKDSGREGDVYDYDLRGAWKASAEEAGNGHLPDTFKKPNHPTFSTDSQYSGKGGATGGTWGKRADGKWTFDASATNLENMGEDGLRQYFSEREPDAVLNVPQSSRWYAKGKKP